jgi:hypothetical protein
MLPGGLFVYRLSALAIRLSRSFGLAGFNSGKKTQSCLMIARTDFIASSTTIIEMS